MTQTRPDLVSATILSGQTGGGGNVDFCFDKTLNNTTLDTGGTDFELGGYRAENVVQGVAAGIETNPTLQPTGAPADSCVRVSYNDPPAGDLDQYTIATVLAGAVSTNSSSTFAAVDNNFADSTLLSGSNTHNGTAGFTVGPDLQSVIPDSTSNSITYAEDQNVVASGAGGPIADDFYFVEPSGTTCYGNSVNSATGGPDVVINFPSNCPVTNAVRAGELHGAVESANDAQSSDGGPAVNADSDKVVPAPYNTSDPSGSTELPDLSGVTIESNQSAMDFTFDAPVDVSDFSDFHADLSTGDEINGNGAQIIAGGGVGQSTTVRVTFANFSYYDEYVVGGSVSGFQNGGCAAFESGSTSGNTGDCNTNGEQPVAAPFGNSGAFAEGFTTAPDVLSATGNTTTGVVTLVLDQRAFGYQDASNIQLLDQFGDPSVQATGSGISIPSQSAGQQAVTIQFAANQVKNASNLDIGPCTFYALAGEAANSSTNTSCSSNSDGSWTYSPPKTGGSCTGNDCGVQYAVDQILALAKSSSRAYRFHEKAPSRAAIAKRNARIARAERARLAKLRRLAAARRHARRHARHHARRHARR